jgi:DNA-binding MarR family transcriptional regulator
MAARVSREQIGRLRGSLARIARSIERQVPGGEGLTRSQMWILGTVGRLGPMGMGELAEFEGINPTMLSRVADERDGRAVRVELTEAGVAVRDKVRVERSDLFAERLAELPDDYTAKLLDALPALEALGELMRRTPKKDA